MEAELSINDHPWTVQREDVPLCADPCDTCCTFCYAPCEVTNAYSQLTGAVRHCCLIVDVFEMRLRSFQQSFCVLAVLSFLESRSLIYLLRFCGSHYGSDGALASTSANSAT